MDDKREPETTAPEEGHHHLTARERQRRGPMWGCLRSLFFLSAGGLLLLALLVGTGWWYLGSTNFAGLVKLRIEKTLEARLGRDVVIGQIEIVRTRPQKVILRDVRIANAPGGKARYFATVKEVIITGGIESFWSRRVNVGRVDIVEPSINFEVFPAGSKLAHNFPVWKSGPRSKYEIVHVDLNQLFLRRGTFSFLDRKRNISAVAANLASDMKVTRAEDLYAGLVTSPSVVVRIQDYVPFDVTLRGGFRFTPGALELQSVALRGREIEAFIAGKITPLSEARYDLSVRAKSDLSRIKEIFKVKNTLDGPIALDGRLRGDAKSGFSLTGRWGSSDLKADAYDLADVRGTLDISDIRSVVNVDRARYGGGTVAAKYLLEGYDKPLPMSVDLRYDRVSLEKLFSDWGVEGTGLRGAATGQLTYQWEDDRLLEGTGTGNAKLTRNTLAFSDAKYPVPIAGATAFDLNRGVIRFRNGTIDTGATQVAFNGTLKIEGLHTDLGMDIRSTDLSELDRIGYNFAKSAGKSDYELLGIGGSGTIKGTINGPIESPVVTADINASDAHYNDVLLGDATIALRYDGPRSALVFDRAVFTDGGGRLALNGTITFPDNGPGPRFDIAVEAFNYPVERAIKAVGLELAIRRGLGTGSMVVAGTPESGSVRFAGLTIRDAAAELKLNGTVRWLPGEGNVAFDLDIAANGYPASEVIAFLDLGEMPITGAITGTMHLEGTKNALEGAGSMTVREGTVYGEPVDFASADIVFDQGKLRANDIVARGPAGEITGRAEFAFETKAFNFDIKAPSIDLSKVRGLASLSEKLGGKLSISTQGAGTLDQPEIVVDATLHEGVIRGLNLPQGTPPPQLYVAIRNGQLIVRGSAADAFTIEGGGTVGEQLAVDGVVRITIPDIAKLLALSPNAAAVPASGNAIIDLRLGGRLSPIEALRVEGSVPELLLKVADHEFTAARPLRFTLLNGRVTFDDFELQRADSTFAVTGFAEITGEQRIDIGVRGAIEGELLQLLMPGLRASGTFEVAAGATGTLKSPSLTGTADIRDGEFRIPGFPQGINDVNGTLVFRGDRIEVESLRATVGGGRVVLGGTVLLNGMKLAGLRMAIQGEDVALRYFEGMTIEGDFNMLLSGDLERLVLQGEVNVDRALYFKDIDFRQSLLDVLLTRRAVVPTVAATWQDRVALRLHVNAPGTIAVRNNIADVTGGTELDVTGTLANPVVLGEVALNEGGTITFQNIEYRLVRGTITFQNPFRIDPYFDITVEGRMSGAISEIESGPIDVTINVTGTLDRITPTITSDPPTSDITLFSLLGLGGVTGSNGTLQAAPASIVGQSLLIQSLGSYVGSRILPFADSFTYDPGLIDTGTGTGPKVTFEKRLSNSLRLLVVYNLESHKSRQVVEWIADRNWTLQLTRDGIANEFRLDARFRRRYNGYWTWGDRGREQLASSATFDDVADAPAEAIAKRAETPAPARPADVPPPSGPVVLAVSFRADGNLDTSTFMDDVSVKSGAPLSIRDVQSSVKSLFSTGNFRDIRVETTPRDGGVEVTFVLILNYRVGTIEFEDAGEFRTRAESDAVFRRGDVLSLNAVDRSATAIQARLQRNGYLDATVDPEVTFQRDRNLADIILRVTRGTRARIGTVSIAGALAPFDEAALVREMKRGLGEEFHVTDAREDAERIERFLIRKNHRRARVTFDGHDYNVATKTVALRYSVTVGPIVRVEITGVNERAVRRMVAFRNDTPYTEDAVDRTASRIVAYYQERGFYQASVDTESGLDNGIWTTTFNVEPGQRYRTGAITFSGNLLIDDDELRDVITTSERGGIRTFISRLFRRPSAVTSEQLSEDRDSIESHYRLQGFSEATVEMPLVTPAANGTLAIDFPISEGPRTILADVRIEGNEQVQTDGLPELTLRKGDALNPQLLHDDLVALQSHYAERGNVEVLVAPRVVVSDDKTSATLVYSITEGPKVEIGNVAVRGNDYTRTELIERKLDIKPGQPFTFTSLLQAQQNLYRLGIFRRVDVQPDQSGTAIASRNVAIEVEEGQNLTLSGSVGAVMSSQAGGEREISPRISASVAHRNLFGTGRYLGLEGVLSRLEREAYLTYREPYVGRFNVPVQFSIFQQDDYTRKETRIVQKGASVEASRVEGLSTRWSLRYEYKISECKAGDICSLLSQNIGVPGLDRSLVDIQISSITPTVFWDKRDDVTNPTRGFFTSASVEYAFPFLDAESHFVKEFVQAAWYLPVTERSVLALSGRAGLIQSFDVTRNDGTVSDAVPISERFVAGGDTSHRAFPLDLLGDLCEDNNGFTILGCEPTLFRLRDLDDPDDEGRIVPLGGKALLLLNAEYRFPIFSSVGGAVFTDVGNVHPQTIRFDDLRVGFGAGIRYISPVGPIRFDIGWPMNRRPYESPFSYFITLGYAF